MTIERVVVVGASLAGLNAAKAIRRDGYSGELIMVGKESHRPYDRPPLSKEVLTDPNYDQERLILRAATDDGLDLTWRLGEAATGLNAADRSLTLAGGDRLDFDGLVIATGSEPVNLPDTMVPEGLNGVQILRTLEDGLGLRASLNRDQRPRVVICGAGFVGAEVAASARRLGAQVVMVDVAATPMSRVLDPRTGEAVADLHRSNGVDVRLGVGVAGVRTDGGVNPSLTAVGFDDGSWVEADLMLVGIGTVPATGWLDGSGLTIDNGVVVDETCRAAPGIVAAGDIARWPNPRFGAMLRVEQWDNAVDQGSYAGSRLLADLDPARCDPEPYAPVPWFWTDQYDCKIQLAGMTDGEPVVISGSFDDGRLVQAYVDDRGRVIGVLGWNKPRQAIIGRQLIEAGSDLAVVRERLS